MTTELSTVFILLAIYQVKHYLADFPLQNRFMLQKVLSGWDFFMPLAAHCAVHAFLTFCISMYVNPSMWWLAAVDFVAHFIMDRIKASDRYLGRFRDRDKQSYWNCLGFDQMVHHLTHLLIVWLLVAV